MTTPGHQTEEEACARFVEWLDEQVIAAGRGDKLDTLTVDPAATFWLGRLAAEDEVRSGPVNDRYERLDPCAIGIRLRPAGGPPWSMTVTVRACAWVSDGAKAKERTWHRTQPIEVPVAVTVDGARTAFGREQIEAAFAAVGAPGLSAEVRVEVEDWHERTELVVQLVNTSPKDGAGPAGSHLFETQIEVAGLETVPFQLEALPDSFRYRRNVPAYGINVGVEQPAPGVFRTTDTVTVQTYRPDYWNGREPQPDLSFERLATDPLPPLTELVEALAEYDEAHWSAAVLQRRAVEDGWTPEMRKEAEDAADEVFAELNRLRAGLAVLRDDPLIRRAFQLMNQAIARSAGGRYESWRAFQVGFLLSVLPFLKDPKREAETVDTVWFATGGGKTETYLGLLLTTAFFDRLRGKSMGVTAWSRFPLRLLSLQQTQRFADALAQAELVRRENGVGGSPFSLGFLVGTGSTPNRIVPSSKAEEDVVTPDSPGMPDQYRVLLRCPFCRDENLRMSFDRATWRLNHLCTNPDCVWTGKPLPVFVVDQEIFRFLPTVVVGTLDKAASIGLQQAMRGLVGAPLGLCSVRGHGFTYAPRRSSPNGCLVPDCRGGTPQPLPMDPKLFGLSLRLQDELHLLRDSLGAVDSHYESLLDHLQEQITGTKAKIVASSATLTGYDRQVGVLYRRRGRVFPQPGPRAGESFWTRPTNRPLRRFVAVAPRGVTLEHVSDRTVDALQRCVRRLLHDAPAVCTEADIDERHVPMLLKMYGTNVVYGTTVYDVEAAERSLDSNSTVEGITSTQLTGSTNFDDVRTTLHRLQHPEDDFAQRIHVVVATSMLSHGVDVDALNTMVMLGLPLTTAEFIQTTARVGRRYPGLVYVLHKIGRERDAETFRHFRQYVEQGDRFVDPIPVTRRSRRVLDLTLPGLVAARTLMIREPASRRALTTVARLREYADESDMTAPVEAQTIIELLGFDGEEDTLHRDQIMQWMTNWFANLRDLSLSKEFPKVLGAREPMRSLRDVEPTVPIHEARR